MGAPRLPTNRDPHPPGTRVCSRLLPGSRELEAARQGRGCRGAVPAQGPVVGPGSHLPRRSAALSRKRRAPAVEPSSRGERAAARSGPAAGMHVAPEECVAGGHTAGSRRRFADPRRESATPWGWGANRTPANGRCGRGADKPGGSAWAVSPSPPSPSPRPGAPPARRPLKPRWALPDLPKPTGPEPAPQGSGGPGSKVGAGPGAPPWPGAVVCRGGWGVQVTVAVAVCLGKSLLPSWAFAT